MSMEQVEPFLPDSITVQLDQLLAEWRKERQLSPLQIETMRQRVLEMPGELSSAWWEAYINYLNTWLAQTDRYTQHFGMALHRNSVYRYHRARKPNVRLQITPDWQPYLRPV